MMQGYITLATGSRFYIELATNLALSLKLNDPKRPVCIVLDQGTTLPPEYRPYFDAVAYLDSKPGFHGCLNKLRVNEVSPFDETMFVDSDCILVKDDMERHWLKFQSPGFSIAGGKVTTGHWYGFNIADVLAKLGITYMVKMNSGVFYFRKGRESSAFFETALALVDSHKDVLGTFHRNKLQLADEPFIGAALGILNISPLSYDPRDGSIMVTTVKSSKVHFDPLARVSTLLKHDDFRLLGRYLPRMKLRHSPSFAHFVKLKPRSEYHRIANQLRSHFALPLFTP